MRLAVFGVGGVGGYFGARLWQAGVELALVARGAHLTALRAHGLRVESALGNVHVHPVQATSDAADIGPVDWVLCGVKTWQVGAAAQAMRPLIGPDTTVLPLQNGVEAPDELAAVLGAEHVVGGAAWISASIAEPGLVRHVAAEPRLVLGELDGSATRRCAELVALLARAGVRAEVAADVRVTLWTKLLFIAASSGVGAVARVPIGELRACGPTRHLLQAAMEETARLAHARGIALAPDVVAETLRYVDSLPAGTTPSMQRDIVAGRPSELEAQSGAIARLARAAGVPVPTHEFLHAALLPQELRARAATVSVQA
jgi:2-dehydropantoate 2-reductase